MQFDLQERLEDARRRVRDASLELLSRPSPAVASASSALPADPLLPLGGQLRPRTALAFLRRAWRQLGLRRSPARSRRRARMRSPRCFRRTGAPVLSLAPARKRATSAVGTEVRKKASRRNRAHALLAPRIHCLRMAAACSSSKSIICSSRFCGVRPSLLVRSAIRLGDCSRRSPSAAAVLNAGPAARWPAAAGLPRQARPRLQQRLGRRPQAEPDQQHVMATMVMAVDRGCRCVAAAGPMMPVPRPPPAAGRSAGTRPPRR